MEHAAGVPLQSKWPQMKGDRRVSCIDALYRQMNEVVNLPFSRYGSLYLPDAKRATSGPLDVDVYIGPHCGTRYWDCNVNDDRYYHDRPPNRGPWANIAEYCDGLVDAEISKLPPPTFIGEELPAYHGSIETHRALLTHARNLIKVMAEDARIRLSSAPVLFHPDLNMRNIFVSEKDPTIITGIIDWQAASIEPAFWYSDEVPGFATPVEAEDNVSARTFNIACQYHTPAISRPRLLDENLFRPFRHSYRTWKDGVVALHHELIETSRHWQRLGFAGQCPFQLTSTDELSDHQTKYRLFEGAQNLRYDLANLLNCASDGWVPAEEWDATKRAHKELYNGIVKAVVENENVDEDEPVRDEATLRSIWPFDLP